MHDHYEIQHWQQLTARTVKELAAYRYEVFVQHLKWPLECDHRHRQELDEFDLMGDTRYVLRRNRQHLLTGCARLMPADGPSVSRKLFTDLFLRHPLPTGPGSWELSRLAATRPGPSGGKSVFGGAMPLLSQVLSYAETQQIAALYAVTFSLLQKR